MADPSLITSKPSISAMPAREVERDVAQHLHDARVARSPEPHEVVVLAHDLVAGPGEVQREGGHVAAEVVHVEHEVAGQIVLGAPHHEAHAGVREAVLVARHVDRLHLREAEVPLEVGVEERRHEASARGVDVDRHVRAVSLVVGDDPIVDLLDRLELAGEGRAEDRDHPDGVLVDARHHVVGIDDVAASGDRRVPRLDVPVAAELLPHHLHVRAEDHVRAVGGLAGRLLARPPAPLHRQSRRASRLRSSRSSTRPPRRRWSAR